MKNLFMTMALMIALLGSSTAFADEAVVSTDKAVVQQTEKTADILAFQDVQSFSASDEELKVAGTWKIKIFGVNIAGGKHTPGCQVTFSSNRLNGTYNPKACTNLF